MKQRIIPIVIILVVLVGLGGYWWYSTVNTADPNKLELSGNIEATQVNVSAETSGRIIEFKADAGAVVKKDDALMRLDDTQAGLALDQAKAALTVAQIQANPAQVALAQSNVNLAELNLKRTIVSAPRDGTVLDRVYETGEFVGQGAVVFTLADLTKVKMVVYVPEDKYGRLRLNQSVDVSTDSYKNDTFKGTITKIANKAEFTPANIETKDQRVNLVYAVTISLDNPDGKLKPGMPADATINLR